jgi:transposase
MPRRGPKCKLGYHRVFNLIVWVLYTGMQWKCLPVPKDPHGKPAIHYTTVYKVGIVSNGLFFEQSGLTI